MPIESQRWRRLCVPPRREADNGNSPRVDRIMPLANPLPKPGVTFWGAALSVTGSMHLVEAAGRRVLLDCGAVRSTGFDARRAPHEFPFAPPEIDAVVLSHAHIDHCGNLPHLVHQGFAGPIYCTPATRDLIALMLADSARIHEEGAFVRRIVEHGRALESGASSPRQDVQRTLQQCVTLPYDQPCQLAPGIQVRLVSAGHLLGSAMIALTVHEAGREHSLTFTGDLGRLAMPLLPAPSPIPPADLVICESTYGARVLDSVAKAAEQLAATVRTTVANKGKVLIPAFSLGRTQLVVDCLVEGMQQGRIPIVPIFVDSPLAAAIVGVYRRHPHCLKPDFATRLDSPAPRVGGEPAVQYVYAAEESQELTERRPPCVIVAPGGMCEGGRIVRHLKHHVDDPRCSVVLVSYQAPHSLGRRLLRPGPRVRIHGRLFNRWANFIEVSGFSGHPDQNELVTLLTPLAATPSRVRLVHGEPAQAAALALVLRRRGFADVAMAVLGETTGLSG
jgi:metallo-beta-lactamase family protein